MLIPTWLQVDKSEIIQGLLRGQYRRWGSVIRVAPGYPGAGQIVTMLRDTALNTAPLAVPPVGIPGVALKGLDFIVNAHGHYKTHRLIEEGFSSISGQLAKTLALTSVGTVASCLTLGLTAVGFSFMNSKLNQLRSAQEEMNSLLRQGFAHLSGKLDEITPMLVELRVIALEQSERQKEILHGIKELHENWLIDHFADLITAMEGLEELRCSEAQRSDFRTYRDDIKKTRLAFAGKLESASLRYSDDPKGFLDTCQFYQGWSIAAAAEVMAERYQGELDRAADKARSFSETARKWTAKWAKDLFPPNEVGGVRRFGHSGFHPRLDQETRRRLYTAAEGHDLERAEIRRIEREGSDYVSREVPRLSSQWFEKQTALAHALDRIEETTERLDSLAVESAFCAEEGLTVRQWEMLPVTTGNAGRPRRRRG